MKNRQFWLLKTEPSTYSYSQLEKDKKTHWNGVRNFQARNFIRQMQKGDLALIYHSGEERAVMGVAQIISEAYPDPDPKKPGDWLQVDIQAKEKLKNAVSLKDLKASKSLKELMLIKQSRLSTMPVSEKEFQQILNMGNHP